MPGFWIPSDDQAKLTLQRMRSLVKEAIADHTFVWWTRDQIEQLVPVSIMNRDMAGIARGIRDYVASHVQFAPDPVGVENLTPPRQHMEILKRKSYVLGDCDDAATLSAAMGESVGIPASFKILAFYGPKNPYQHVITYLHPRGSGVIDMDTTRPAQMLPPTATRSFEMDV